MASAVTIRGFDYMTKRLMPTRENLRRVHRGAAMSEEDIAGVELMLYLIRAADVVRESVYSGLRERELSEGKFALLMTLFDADGPVPVVELAKRIGVSAPTTSVMVTRMVQAENPPHRQGPVEGRRPLLAHRTHRRGQGAHHGRASRAYRQSGRLREMPVGR